MVHRCSPFRLGDLVFGPASQHERLPALAGADASLRPAGCNGGRWPPRAGLGAFGGYGRGGRRGLPRFASCVIETHRVLRWVEWIRRATTRAALRRRERVCRRPTCRSLTDRRSRPEIQTIGCRNTSSRERKDAAELPRRGFSPGQLGERGRACGRGPVSGCPVRPSRYYRLVGVVQQRVDFRPVLGR
jgi:hypothetical protein